MNLWQSNSFSLFLKSTFWLATKTNFRNFLLLTRRWNYDVMKPKTFESKYIPLSAFLRTQFTFRLGTSYLKFVMFRENLL